MMVINGVDPHALVLLMLGKIWKAGRTIKRWISILGSGIDVLNHFNDWLGWFYSGYSGFHPFQKIIKEIQRKDTKRLQKEQK